MKSNMNAIDAGIRAGAGLALLSSPLLDFHTYPYNWLGLIPIGTALFSYCPLYTVLRALVPSQGSGRSHAQSRA